VSRTPQRDGARAEPGPSRFPRLEADEKRLLWLLGGASFFNQYDQGLLSLLLVQIQADLAIPEAQLGFIGSAVRLGTLPAIAWMLLADRIGRRRVLLVTICGYTLFTAATAFAPSHHSLVAFQCLARMFMAAEFMLALVVVVEEFRPSHRGFGIGVLGTLAALGRGLGMILFGFVDVMPLGWRGLYLVGIVPLLLIAMFRRRLPETERFKRLHEMRRDPGSPAAWLRPLRELVQHAPGRVLAVVTVGFLWSFSNGPVDFFLPKYLQDSFGWTPARFAQVAILGGALGLSGQLLAGWASDRVGRKPVLLLFLVLEPVAAIALYAGLGHIVFPLYVTWVFASVANDVVGRTYQGELFPTSHRATASGVVAIVATLGAVLGLACEGLLFGALGSHWTPVRLIATAGILMPLVVWIAYPETSRRGLEEISPEVAEPNAREAALQDAARP
jgi:putative MFS transporter